MVHKALSSSQTEKTKIFGEIRKKGILKTNKEQSKLAEPKYERARNQGSLSNLIMCSSCKVFISKYAMPRHTNVCNESLSYPIAAQMLSNDIDENFKKEILSGMRQDSIKMYFEKDKAIMQYGNYLYRGKFKDKSKVVEHRKSLRNQLRQLARIYLNFEVLKPPVSQFQNALDMFNKANFFILMKCIESMAEKENPNDKSIKSGFKLSCYYLILAAAIFFRAQFLSSIILFFKKEDNMENSTMIENFTSVLKMNEKIYFSDSRVALDHTRQRTTRKPKFLPIESDMSLLRQHIQLIIQNMSNHVIKSQLNPSCQEYITLRNAVCTKLTLLNARRGGEAARLVLTDLKEGLKDEWIDKYHYGKLDELDKKLVDQVKVCYQSGKGTKRLVPLLIPVDCLAALRIITKKEIRRIAGISDNNPFVFAPVNTVHKPYHNHVSGWHILKDVCKPLSLASVGLINATKNRHYISTLYANLNIPNSKERDLFYEHMGHDPDTNRDNYQCPPAISEATSVWKHLSTLNDSEIFFKYSFVMSTCLYEQPV